MTRLTKEEIFNYLKQQEEIYMTNLEQTKKLVRSANGSLYSLGYARGYCDSVVDMRNFIKRLEE